MNIKFTTPKTIEAEKIKAIDAEIEKNKAAINKDRGLEDNMNSFLSAHEIAINTYYEGLEKVAADKLDIIKRHEADLITETIRNREIREIENGLQELKNITADRVNGLGGTLKDYLRDLEGLTGAAINLEDVKLLENITLTQSELNSLVDKHKASSNVTMLRLISEYAKNNDLYAAYKSADQRIETIDRFLNETAKGLNDAKSYYSVRERTEKHRHNHYDNVKAAIAY